MNKLSRFIILDDEELKNALKEITGRLYDEIGLIKARRIFAQTLDNIHNLKIQTIHSFCENLLKRFPLEANLPAEFQIIDEAARKFSYFTCQEICYH